jgi:protein O-mannosyl-transferase
MRAGWAAALMLAVATTVTFFPVVEHQFLNWDDPDVVAANPRLTQPPGALVAWAFTTREMGHYQPLSWLALSAVSGGSEPARQVHAFALTLHTLNAVLLLGLIALVLDRGARGPDRWWVALGAAALFALHPLRVEPVAWASAVPYVLSYAPLLLSVGAWIVWVRGGATSWLVASAGLFGVSQLARTTAPLLPLVLLGLARVDPQARPRPLGAVLRALVPFALIALPLAAAEASAREVESLADIGAANRIAWALTHPALYVWRTLAPIALTTLDAIPRLARPDWAGAGLAVAASAAAVAATGRLWSWRAAVVVWGAYLALLAPVVGLFPSGLQVTADRYTYGPAMVLSAAVALAVSRFARAPRSIALMAMLGLSLALSVSARAQLGHWRDSIALWTRAVTLDADNDVARYNLALALIETSRADEAIPLLEQLVAQVPDHELGRRQLASLLADREQRAGDADANAGRLADAVAAYSRVLTHDPGRTRTRLNRGMALVQLGDPRRAAPDLEAAGAADSADPAVAGALALAWSETGRDADAITLLRAMRRRHPGDLGLSMNLARLLLTATPASLRDPVAALEIASSINDATGGRDPRVLATLAEALAATGRRRDAAEAWGVAIAIAAESGNEALAADLRRRRTLSGR